MTRPRAMPESTVALVRGAVDDVRELAQAEIALVKLEVGERIAGARAQLVFAVPRVAAGAALALLGAVAIVVGCVLLLDVWLRPWTAWLVVGSACSIAGVVLLLRATSRPVGGSTAAALEPGRGSDD